ncbi:MAG: branched-chain amino acid ABC transporter permease [Pseudolabrys sp.]
MNVLSDVLVLTPLYGMVALGFVIIYRFTGVLNFAQGSLFAIGAYLFYLAVEKWHLSLPVAMGSVIIGGFAFGLLLYSFIIRPLSGRSVLAIILVTIALGSVVQGVLFLGFTARPYNLPSVQAFADRAVISIGGHQQSAASVLMMIVYGIILACLGLTFRYLSIGMKGRAAGENPVLASYRGIRVHWVFGVAWAIATVTAFLAGAIHVLNHQLSPAIVEVALHGFAAAMVGGLDSIWGTLVGALLVAFGVSVAFQFVNPLLSDVMPYAIMLVVLYVRPWGVWGSPEVIDRV